MRLIDADEAYKVLTDYYHHRTEIQHEALKEAIERVPTVDAEPVKRGRWIKVEDDYNNHLYECSYCHTWTSLPTEEVNDGNIRYCWSCGAKMYGVKND